MSNTIILQCRAGSTRLPGKALLPLGSLPVAVLAARRASGPAKRRVLATSNEPSDDALAGEAAAHGIEVLRGARDDVLGRFVAALGDVPDDTLVTRLTGDNPVPDHHLIDEVVIAMEARDLDYITTTHPDTGLPYVANVEITRARHLREAAREAHRPDHQAGPVGRHDGCQSGNRMGFGNRGVGDTFMRRIARGTARYRAVAPRIPSDRREWGCLGPAVCLAGSPKSTIPRNRPTRPPTVRPRPRWAS